MVMFAPSILSADFSCLAKSISSVEAGGADILHIDVMDGHFVPNITFGPGIIEAVRGKTNLPFDVHLMIQNPECYIDRFAEAGADIITVHAEACVHLHRVIEQIKANGVKASVALNPATPVDVLQHVIHDLDMVLVMTVNPGFGGQKFIPQMKQKIKKLRELLNKQGLNTDIEVDGGISLQNASEIVESGATILVAGSAVFNSDDVTKTTRLFKKMISSL